MVISYRNVLGKIPRMSFPSVTPLTADEIFFWTEDQPLNEFGFYYAALFIVGNYARYYPDYWMKDIDDRKAHVQIIQNLLASATEVMPSLCFSELSRRLQLPLR